MKLPDYLRIDFPYNLKFNRHWHSSFIVKNIFDRSHHQPSVYRVPAGIQHTPRT
ncbi:MAG: hypothetical protein HRU20_04180 [Pseudomonadales bacterium]|nr:hypothetical protein [Pseudomonadales bacterium]